MDRQQLETALQAANVALTGQRRREASSFASIELKAANPTSGHWEVFAAGAAGLVALTAVVAAWLY